MNTETENGIGLISDQYGQMMFPELTAGVSEHPVKISALQENEPDLTATEAPSFERYFALSGKQGKKIDLNGLSMRMLRECCQATEDMTSLPFSLKWTNSGMISNGRFSTASITPFHRTGKGCILLDILEAEVENKYFLSEAQMRKIVFQSTSSDTETDTDEIHKCLTREGGVEALDTAEGGGRGHHTAVPMCIGGIDKGNAKFGMQFAQQDRIYDGSQTATALTSQLSGNVNNYAIPMFGIDFNVGGQEREISNAITTRSTLAGVTNIKQDGTAVCIPVLTPDRAEKRQNGRRFKDNGEEAFMLTAQDIHGVMISEATAKGYAVPVIWYEKYKCYIAIRKLTPRECFRLQGWTDDYFDKAQFVNSDSQLYKQAGNGITVTVMEDIAKALKEVEKCQRDES